VFVLVFIDIWETGEVHTRFWSGGGGVPERKKPVGRHRNRWEDNIKMDLREMGWGSMDWIAMGQDRDR